MRFFARRNFMKFLTSLIVPGEASAQSSDVGKELIVSAAALPAFESFPIVKLLDYLPKDFVVDGSVDYTQYVQKVLDRFRESGGRMELPPNSSVLVGNLVVYSNTKIYGNKNTSILKVKAGCSGICANPEVARGKKEVKNIILSNFTISGSVENSGFSEHLHLVNMNGISSSLFEDLIITGFQGDGIYLGMVQEGKNVINTRKITISNIVIDGINKNNRNGISIVDGTDILINDVKISRCSKRSMPGAIDIEPDVREARIGDIRISNVQIYDCGGGVGAISVAYGDIPFVTPPGKILIDKVTIDGSVSNAFAFISRKSFSAKIAPMDVDVVLSNSVARNGAGPFTIVGASNVKIINNKFFDFKGSALIGYVRPESKCKKIVLSENTWQNCGKDTGTGLAVYSVSDLKISDEFIDCGAGTVGKANAIEFKLGFSEFVDISGAKFSSPSGKTMVAIKKSIGHFFSPKTNRLGINRMGKLGSDFEVEGTSNYR